MARLYITNPGRQLINDAIGAGQTVLITKVTVGKGFPLPADDPHNYSDLVSYVMDANPTSANAQVLYQTTVRLSVSSANAPVTFKVNEIGVWAHLPGGPLILFAYATTGDDTGDTVTPSLPDSAVVRDYALLIAYSQDAPVSTTITLTPVIQLHGANHRGTGIDPIGLADTVSSGSLRAIPNDPPQVLIGTHQWAPIPHHAPTHLDNGVDPIPVATIARTGSLPKLSGNQSDALAGDGSWQNRFLPPGVMMDFAGDTAPGGWLLCDGSEASRTTFPALFAIIGIKYGAGNGTTSFNLPDARGRVAIGAGQGSGLTNRTLGQSGGAEALPIGLNELPPHIHPVNDPGHLHTLTDPGHNHPHSDPGHSHGITQTPHGHAITDPGHVHPLNSLPNTSGGAGPVGGVITQQPGPTDTTYSAQTRIGIVAADANLSINSNPSNVINVAGPTGISVQSQPTGISVGASTGAGAAHSSLQPFFVTNKIIKT